MKEMKNALNGLGASLKGFGVALFELASYLLVLICFIIGAYCGSMLLMNDSRWIGLPIFIFTMLLFTLWDYIESDKSTFNYKVSLLQNFKELILLYIICIISEFLFGNKLVVELVYNSATVSFSIVSLGITLS